jgi:hypothetical protein
MVSNKQKKIPGKNLFMDGISKATDEKSRIRSQIRIQFRIWILNLMYGPKDPDASENVTDPEH